MHAFKVHSFDVHAFKVHAFKVHAFELHAFEVNALLTLYSGNPIFSTQLATCVTLQSTDFEMDLESAAVGVDATIAFNYSIETIFTELTYIHKTNIYSQNEHMFTEQTYVHRMNICSQNKHMFTERTYVHRTNIYSQNEHIFTERTHVHKTNICSQNEHIVVLSLIAEFISSWSVFLLVEKLQDEQREQKHEQKCEQVKKQQQHEESISLQQSPTMSTMAKVFFIVKNTNYHISF